MESVYADAVFGWLGGGGALARVTYPWYELLHHNPTPILSCGKKKVKCGKGSNHLLTPVGQPSRLLASFSSRVSYSGSGSLLRLPYPSDEILEWVSNSYFLKERTQTAEREKR